MKINFELDTNDLNDVLDTIRMLDSCIGGKYLQAIDCKEISQPLLGGEYEENVLISGYEVKIKNLESEIVSLKKELEDSSKNKYDELSVPSVESIFGGENNTSELTDKISSLESLNKELEEKNSLLKKEVESLSSENNELKENSKSVDLSSFVEKAVHERIVGTLNKEIEYHKGRSEKNFQKNKDLRTSIDNLAKEKKELESKLQIAENSSSHSNEDIEDLNCTIAKLKEDVEYHKGRSDRNYQNLNQIKDEIKILKKENQELSAKLEEKSSNNDNIDIERIKADFAEQKSKYESQISELKLACDKTENELACIRSKYKEEEFNELNELRYIKKTICSNDRGRAFWCGIESQVKSKLNSK